MFEDTGNFPKWVKDKNPLRKPKQNKYKEKHI